MDSIQSKKSKTGILPPQFSFWLILSLLVLLLLPLSSKNYSYIDSAKKYTYVREIKPNRSTEIDGWNRYVKNPLGASYCGAFVSSMLKNVKYPKIKSGLARNFYSKSIYTYSAEDVFHKRAKVKKGDLVIWRRGSTIYGHVGIVLSDWNWIEGYTIEGNTSSGKGSQYDGDGVFIRKRKIELYNFFRIMGFARVIE